MAAWSARSPPPGFGRQVDFTIDENMAPWESVWCSITGGDFLGAAVGDHNEWHAIKVRVCDTVDDGGRTGTQGRQTRTGRARQAQPGRSP